MSAFKAKLEARRNEERCPVDGAEWIDGYMAGARAALEIAADGLLAHDTHRYAGDMNGAYNAAMDFADEQLRARASEIA